MADYAQGALLCLRPAGTPAALNRFHTGGHCPRGSLIKLKHPCYPVHHNYAINIGIFALLFVWHRRKKRRKTGPSWCCTGKFLAKGAPSDRKAFNAAFRAFLFSCCPLPYSRPPISFNRNIGNLAAIPATDPGWNQQLLPAERGQTEFPDNGIILGNQDARALHRRIYRLPLQLLL